MFCSQCEQTARGQGCEQWGACGKSPEVDALQDLLTHCLRGLGEVALAAHQLGIHSREANIFSCETLFSTLTNVNFDPKCFVQYIQRAIALRDDLKAKIQLTGIPVEFTNLSSFQPADTLEALIQQGKDIEFEFISSSQQALELPGFTEDGEPRQVLTGFARNAVLSVAGEVIEAVKRGEIRHFFLVGGCDGAKSGRSYYSEFVEKVPQDCVVLTLACGKFRFFDKDLGDIGGIPRLMDVGQCNDAYSAIQIALALSNAFNVDVNQLPLSMILSWYEQKAVSILLTLLYLGIQDIRLGPTLPAFISPNVFKLLSEKYNLKPITTPDQDLAACLG